MGQYYRNSFLKVNWKTAKQPVEMTLSPYDFSNGAKLMEFSYIGNGLMKAVEYLMANHYYGHPFVCVGDYADKKMTTAYPAMEIRRYGNVCDFSDEIVARWKELLTLEDFEKFMNDKRIEVPYNEETWNYFKNTECLGVDGTLNIYDAAHEVQDAGDEKEDAPYNKMKGLIPEYEEIPYYKYLINFTKKEYVVMPKYSKREWRIHPLSLLCADGNGRGGGDYREMHDKDTGDLIPNDYDKVGIWAYDKIGITNDKNEVKGFTELKVNFREDF